MADHDRGKTPSSRVQVLGSKCEVHSWWRRTRSCGRRARACPARSSATAPYCPGSRSGPCGPAQGCRVLPKTHTNFAHGYTTPIDADRCLHRMSTGRWWMHGLPPHSSVTSSSSSCSGAMAPAAAPLWHAGQSGPVVSEPLCWLRAPLLENYHLGTHLPPVSARLVCCRPA